MPTPPSPSSPLPSNTPSEALCDTISASSALEFDLGSAAHLDSIDLVTPDATFFDPAPTADDAMPALLSASDTTHIPVQCEPHGIPGLSQRTLDHASLSASYERKLSSTRSRLPDACTGLFLVKLECGMGLCTYCYRVRHLVAHLRGAKKHPFYWLVDYRFVSAELCRLCALITANGRVSANRFDTADMGTILTAL